MEKKNRCEHTLGGNVSGVYFCLGIEENSSYKIKYYIHELQNFYYFLCGEELVLK
jgi:hypothetical protein